MNGDRKIMQPIRTKKGVPKNKASELVKPVQENLYKTIFQQ